MNIDLKQGDCLEIMKTISNESIDCICCDLPYQKTRGKWDNIIEFNAMWEQVIRISKPNAPIVLFGNEPFSSMLRMSNIDLYKYDIKWVKNRATGFANCNYRPMNRYEDIIVFSKANASVGGKKNAMTYNPQGLIVSGKKKKNKNNRHGLIHNDTNNIGSNNMFSSDTEYVQKYTNYPDNIHFEDVEAGKNVHPTQKPILLMEFLIKTFSNVNDTVLDFTMGSGSTMVTCQNTNRNGIGIELDEHYFAIAKKRVVENKKELNAPTLFNSTD